MIIKLGKRAAVCDDLRYTFQAPQQTRQRRLHREKDGGTALRDGLYELVATRDEPLLAIDLAKVDYLSSSGVAILVGLKRRVETKGGKIVIFHVQPIVRDLLAVMKLDRFFAISENETKAIDSLRSLPTA